MRILVIVVVALAAVACSDAPSESDCRKLLDHTIRIDLTESGAKITDEKIDAIKKTLDGDFIAECRDKISKGRVACALKAKTKQEIAACDEG